MTHSNTKLRPGDLVEVRSPGEILQTLDGDGALDRLPFMPEMIQFCGRRFRVAKRAVKTCYYGESSGMRKFPDEDVVMLENVRCSGLDHDGCQKACLIFWREVWLRKLTPKEMSAGADVTPDGTEALRPRLKTVSGPNTYFCQSSEILRATVELSRWERFGKCLDEVRSGNCGLLEMAGRIAVWVYWRARRVLFGPYGRGSNKATPATSLNLVPGEPVQVKSMQDIRETLDARAHNRGLFFTPSMGHLCGQQRTVERKIEKIIVDGTGQMRKLRNTVYLEGEKCECSCVAFGGCPRGEFSYWREIWLRRTRNGSQAGDAS